MQQPELSKGDALNYCQKTRMTCCNRENFEFLRPTFTKGIQQLNRNFEIIEEVFLMFNGPKILKNLKMIQLNEKLRSKSEEILQHQIYLENVNTIEDFIEEYKTKFLKLIRRLNTRIHVIKKNIKSFHGNMICSLCDPLNTEYIQIKHKF